MVELEVVSSSITGPKSTNGKAGVVVSSKAVVDSVVVVVVFV